MVPKIDLVWKPANVLNPGCWTEEFKILAEQAEQFELRHRIRRHAAGSMTKLRLITSLIGYSDVAPICSDLAERFEALLSIREPHFRQDLLELLDMPETEPSPAEPKLPEAA